MEQILNYRNLKWLSADHAIFDCEIEHEEMGWIPYSCCESDNGIGAQLWSIRDTLDIEEYVAPVVDIKDVRNAKLLEISRIADSFEQSKCDDMYLDSSLGFRINADRRSQQNIEGLAKVLGDNTTMFKIYDNEFRELGVGDLNILIVECIQNGLNLYSQKFAMRAQVMALKTIEEIENFEVKFEMVDFTI